MKEKHQQALKNLDSLNGWLDKVERELASQEVPREEADQLRNQINAFRVRFSFHLVLTLRIEIIRGVRTMMFNRPGCFISRKLGKNQFFKRCHISFPLSYNLIFKQISNNYSFNINYGIKHATHNIWQ